MIKCSFNGCGNQANREMKHKNYSYYYCNKHYRFKGMKDGARQRKKYMPSYNELESLLLKYASDMKCYRCNKDMIWHEEYRNRSDVITLQHNHDGTIELICFGCNAMHGNSYLKDDIWKIHSNEFCCPKCSMIKFLEEFHIDKRTKNGRRGICKMCAIRQKRRYDFKNRSSRKLTSCYHGVSKQKNKKYTAMINMQGKSKRIGTWETEEEAAIARDRFIIDNKLDVTKYKLNYPMDFYD